MQTLKQEAIDVISKMPEQADIDEIMYRLYVMDNHRLALWCWWQQWDGQDEVQLGHIDRHYDAIGCDAARWGKRFKSAHKASLDEYLEAEVELDDGDALPLYRWDNNVAAFLSLHADQVATTVMATGDGGDKPEIGAPEYVNAWWLIQSLQWALSEEQVTTPPWIINVDLDYFTCSDQHGDFRHLHSRRFIVEVGELLREGYERGRFRVVTVALSPETTGGWPVAEEILDALLESWPCKPAFPA